MALSVPKKDKKNAWSVAIFENFRSDLVQFVKSKIVPLLESKVKHILINAPVKSGKREIVEYIAMRDHVHNPSRVHAFISSFIRKADESQRDELKLHNMEVFNITSENNVNAFVKWINKKIAEGKSIVIHMDECDYGSGKKQLLNKAYKQYRHNTSTAFIMYSATPQEVLFSDTLEKNKLDEDTKEILHDFKDKGYVVFEPPDTYCGAKKFIDSNLVNEAMPFFHIINKNGDVKVILSEQGKLIIKNHLFEIDINKSKRNILVLRLSYYLNKQTTKNNKSIYKFIEYLHTIPELSKYRIIVDKDERDIPTSESDRISYKTIEWSNKNEWEMLRTDTPIILIMDQTSCRSTEWVFHDRIFALHDYRNTITYTTLAQAQLRVCHYIGKYYDSFQPIKIYGHVNTFKLAAGIISYSDYRHEWTYKKLNKDEIKRHKLDTEEKYYYICRSDDNSVIHPEYSDPVDNDGRDLLLDVLGCNRNISISPRIKGSSTYKAEVNAEFFKCNKDNFDKINKEIKVKYPETNFQNPFIESEEQGLYHGKYKGYLREWEIFNFEDIKNKLWGSGEDKYRRIICYNNNELGIAVIYKTDNIIEKNTLKSSSNSMYS
jgi:hypothetical protein